MNLKLTFIEEVKNETYLNDKDTEKVLKELEKDYYKYKDSVTILEIVEQLYCEGEISIWDNAEKVETVGIENLEIDNYGNEIIEKYLRKKFLKKT